MTPKEIRDLSAQEIQQKLRELRDELTGLRVRKTSGQVENPARFGAIRKDIARLETIVLQKTAAPKA